MPAVFYYLGRPAGFWIAVMSGPAQASAENPAATSLASAQAAEPAAQRRTPDEPSARAVTAASTSPLAVSSAQGALGSGDQQLRGFGGGQATAGEEQVEAVEAGQQAQQVGGSVQGNVRAQDPLVS